MADAPPEARQRLVATRDDLLRSVEESAARIDDVSRRLRRFVSLDEAEIKAADLNDLLTDVTILHRDEIEKAHARLEFDLEKELPPLTCRPQLLTAAFSTLLSNALHAVNGDGRISIQTRGRGDEVEVTIRDNGKGMSAEEADTIFDPTFKVAEGRVSSSNWSLFNSRQIVYEHGGEIRLETEPGRGTAVHVTLPVV
jgi:signal transduction histidine kinase